LRIFDYLTHVIFTKEVRLADDFDVAENDQILKGAVGEIDDTPGKAGLWVPVQDVDDPEFVYKDYCCIYDLEILTSPSATKRWKWARVPNKKVIDYRIFS
jgi:hypothetical protein